jgi:hypothetical protein
MPAPFTKAITQHVVSIRVNGQTVGYMQSWNADQSRDLTRVYEINAATSGRCVEVVPGNVGGDSLDISRYDIYRRLLWRAFGFEASIVHLADHLRPFDVKEIWKTPQGDTYGTLYTGCWFSSTGRNMASTGADRIVMAAAKMEVTDRLPLR